MDHEQNKYKTERIDQCLRLFVDVPQELLLQAFSIATMDEYPRRGVMELFQKAVDQEIHSLLKYLGERMISEVTVARRVSGIATCIELTQGMVPWWLVGAAQLLPCSDMQKAVYTDMLCNLQRREADYKPSKALKAFQELLLDPHGLLVIPTAPAELMCNSTRRTSWVIELGQMFGPSSPNCVQTRELEEELEYLKGQELELDRELRGKQERIEAIREKLRSMPEPFQLPWESDDEEEE